MDILNNLTVEKCQDMESAAKQYLLLRDNLRHINLRLQRAEIQQYRDQACMYQASQCDRLNLCVYI